MSKEIVQWLNKDLKLSKQVNFQTLWYLNDLEEAYKDKADDKFVKRNFSKTIEIMARTLKINITSEVDVTNHFVILNILKEILQARGKPILASLSANKTYLTQLTQSLNKDDTHLIKTFLTPERKLGIPPKIQKIEEKLEKYRAEKIRHEIMARREKEDEEERDRNMVQDLRDFERTKLKKNKEYIQEQQKKGFENWKVNQTIKLTRLKKEKNVNDFLTSKIKKAITEVKEHDNQEFTEELKYFAENCQRLGVELKHDPTKKTVVEKAPFSKVATMMKIRERIQIHDHSKKEREIRLRKKLVDQKRAQEEYEKRRKEDGLLERFLEQTNAELDKGIKNWKKENKKAIQIELRKNVQEQNRNKQLKNFEVFLEKNKKEMDMMEMQRKDQFHELKMQYRELNLAHKIQKRKQHKLIIDDVIDFIIDLTELCHIQQEERGTLHIEGKYWRNAMELFIENKPLIEEKTFKIFEQTGAASTFMKFSSVRSEKENDKELRNYISCLMNWQPQQKFIVDNEDPFENINNSPELLFEEFNNNNAAEIISSIIEKLFPMSPPKKKENLPSHLPLKISLIGPLFAGKKTVCKALKETYGLEILIPDQIIKEAITFAFPPEEVVDPKKAAAKKPAPGGKKAEEEQPKKEDPELREIGVLAKETLDGGKEVSDELYIRAIIWKIRSVFGAERDPDDVLNEIKDLKMKEMAKQAEIQKQLEEAEKKLKKAPPVKAPVNKNAKPDQANKPVEAKPPVVHKNYFYTAGWVLIDFPRTLKQAKLLEEKMTGFVPENERKNPIAEKKKEQLEIIMKKSQVQNNDEQAIQVSGLDLVINLSAEENECVRRAVGRRRDPTTEVVYHVEDNPPPTDVKGLAERLQIINDPESSEEKIRASNKFFQTSMTETIEWFNHFGITLDETGELVPLFRECSGQGKKEEVVEKIKGLLMDILDRKHANYEEMLLNKEKQKHLEEERKLQEEMEKAQKEKEEQTDLNTKSEQEKPGDELHSNPGDELHSKPAEKVINEKEEKKDSNSELELMKLKMEEEAFEVSRMNLKILFEKHLENSQAKSLLAQWEDIMKIYIRDMRQALLRMKEQRDLLQMRGQEVQRKFLEIIERPDDKFKQIKIFQNNFNRFLRDNPEMIKEKLAKEELIRYLDKIYDNIWDILDNKKNDSINERTNICNSGWIETEMENVISNFQKLMQIELNRTVELLLLIQNLSDALNKRNIVETIAHLIIDPFHKEAIPDLEDDDNSDNFPKFEKIYQHALDLAENSIIHVKTNRKTRVKAYAAPPSQLVCELVTKICISAMDKERNVTKNRIKLLRVFAIARLKELRILAAGLYAKLDDWIIFGIKNENDLIYEAVNEIRDAISSEKLSNHPPIAYNEISNLYQQFNYITPDPYFLPSYETAYEERFTIAQLKLLVEETKTLISFNGTIENLLFLNFLSRRVTNPETRKTLPKILHSLTSNDIKRIINYFDFEQKGEIDWRRFCIYFILLNSPVLSKELRISYEEVFSQHGEIFDCEDFINSAMWFDDSQKEENSYENYIYPRQKMIKKLITEILQDENRQINLREFLDLCTARSNLRKRKEKRL